MPLGRYRIVSPTLALILEDGRQIGSTVPEGTIVWVSAELGSIVEIFWDDKKAKMLSIELASHAEKVE